MQSGEPTADFEAEVSRAAAARRAKEEARRLEEIRKREAEDRERQRRNAEWKRINLLVQADAARTVQYLRGRGISPRTQFRLADNKQSPRMDGDNKSSQAGIWKRIFGRSHQGIPSEIPSEKTLRGWVITENRSVEHSLPDGLDANCTSVPWSIIRTSGLMLDEDGTLCEYSTSYYTGSLESRSPIDPARYYLSGISIPLKDIDNPESVDRFLSRWHRLLVETAAALVNRYPIEIEYPYRP